MSSPHEELLSEILVAFDGVSLGNERSLFQVELDCLLPRDQIPASPATPWQQLHMELIGPFVDDVTLLSPEAFRFYLPAFLCEIIRGETAATRVPWADKAFEFLVYILCDSNMWSPERINVLSHRQRKAVVAFLNWSHSIGFCDRDEIADAVESWNLLT